MVTAWVWNLLGWAWTAKDNVIIALANYKTWTKKTKQANKPEHMQQTTNEDISSKCLWEATSDSEIFQGRDSPWYIITTLLLDDYPVEKEDFK